MEEKRPFTGFVVSGEPVTTQKAREAGIIKKSKVVEKPEDYPMRTEPITQEDYVEMVREAFHMTEPIKTDNDEEQPKI